MVKKKSSNLNTSSSVFKVTTLLSSLSLYAKNQINKSFDNYVEKNVTPKIVKYSEVSITFLIGLILLLVGIAQYLAYLMAFLENGLNYIVLGTFLLIIAYLLAR